jgi:arylsulfatase A-like enzyme
MTLPDTLRRSPLTIALVALLSTSLPAQESPRFVRGDVNADGSIDISDGVATLLFLFGGGTTLSCVDAADPNDTGDVDVSDAIFVFNYLFLGGVQPSVPFPDCGADPTQDDLGCLGFDPCDDGQPSEPRNILLIISDDIGVDWASCYATGANLPSTPNLDRLCEEGVVFTNAWAYPVCSPTRATMLSGRYGFRTGVGAPVARNEDGLDPDELTIPDLLDMAPGVPYAHAAIGKWHLGGANNGRRNSPGRLGFSHYSGAIGGGVGDYYDWTKTVNGSNSSVTRYATSETIDDALGWIDDQDSPWFLWLAFNAPHAPFHLPPDDLHSVEGLTGTTQHIAANPSDYYRAMIEAMDTEIGRLLGSLDPEVRARTDVIYIGDNGTPGRVARAPLTRTTAKDSLYQGGVHVPLVVAGPSVANGGRSVDALATATDIFATVLDLAGIDLETAIPDGTRVDSLSLVPYLTGEEPETPRTHAVAEIFGANSMPDRVGKAIRGTRYKLIRFDTRGDELYDLVSDPDETDDLLSSPPLSAVEQTAYDELRETLETLLATE